MAPKCYNKQMAMVVYNSKIYNRSGKSGGNIYRHDNCGHHIQGWPRLVDYPLPALVKARRRCFSDLVHNYLKHFSQEQAGAWQDYANYHPKTNKKGETIALTWWNAFIRFNINNCVKGKPIITWPP